MPATAIQSKPEIQRPAGNLFVLSSLLAALFLNGLPWEGIWLMLRPDFVALVLLYWCTHKPWRIGIGLAWMVGIFADVADASLFGQHALAYSVLMFGAIFLHRRIRMFALPYQIAHVAAMLVAQQLLQLLVRLVAGAESPGVVWFAASLTGAALWPVLVALLKIPLQRRSNPDDV